METIDKLVYILTFLSVLGSGLIAGLFFVFSIAIMRALGRIPAAEGISAMQSINVVIVNPVFLFVFLGTGVACLGLAIVSALKWQADGSGYLLFGALAYIIGSILLTMFINVPLNDALAAISPTDPSSGGLWSNYLSNWTMWNHVRTIASLAATALLMLSLLYRNK
jgi:uncharacterized membrane protein